MKQRNSIYWLLALVSVVYQFCVPIVKAQAIEVIEVEGQVIEFQTDSRNTRTGRNVMIGDILDPSYSIRLESSDTSLTLRCNNGQRRVVSTNSSSEQVVRLSSICHSPGQSGDGNYDDSVQDLMNYGTPPRPSRSAPGTDR